jgi:NCAIR mutase (PurE)-related protein
VTQPEALKSLLQSVAAGEVNPDVALEKLKHFAYEPVGDFARIDHHRKLRTGFPEVIWGQDKTPEQIAQIMEVMRQHNSVVMATRIEPEVYNQLQEKIADLRYYPTARICTLPKREARRNSIF